MRILIIANPQLSASHTLKYTFLFNRKLIAFNSNNAYASHAKAAALISDNESSNAEIPPLASINEFKRVHKLNNNNYINANQNKLKQVNADDNQTSDKIKSKCFEEITKFSTTPKTEITPTKITKNESNGRPPLEKILYVKERLTQHVKINLDHIYREKSMKSSFLKFKLKKFKILIFNFLDELNFNKRRFLLK